MVRRCHKGIPSPHLISLHDGREGQRLRADSILNVSRAHPMLLREGRILRQSSRNKLLRGEGVGILIETRHGCSDLMELYQRAPIAKNCRELTLLLQERQHSTKYAYKVLHTSSRMRSEKLGCGEVGMAARLGMQGRWRVVFD